MAITQADVVGPILLPSGEVPAQGKILFSLNAWDVEADSTIIPGPASVDLDEAGDFTASLWCTTEGGRTVSYRAKLQYWSTARNRLVDVDLSSFVLEPGGPYDLSTLLAQPPVEMTGPDVLAVAQAAATSAAQDADRAETAAASAADDADRAETARDDAQGVLEDRQRRDVATLLADTTLTYTAAQPGTVEAGDIVRTRAEGFAYEVAASGAVDHHISTAGGVKLYFVGAATYSGAASFESAAASPTGAFILAPQADSDLNIVTTGDGALKIDAAWGITLTPQSIGPDYGGDTIAISGGTYTSATGVMSLTLASAHGLGVNDAVRVVGASGVGVSPWLNGYFRAKVGTTGATLVLSAQTGLGDATFSGGSVNILRLGGINYRGPVENMSVNFLIMRNGGYLFENDNASWIMQMLPSGVNIGSPNTSTETDTPKNTLEVGGGNPGSPNGFFANAMIGRDWARVYTAPPNSLVVQQSIFAGGLSAPYQTSTISSATYDSVSGLVTVTLAGSVGLSGYQFVRISGATGTGDYARINGNHITLNGTSGTTLLFYIGAGLTMTITGGSVRGNPAVRVFADGANYLKLVGVGGAAFVPVLPLEARNATGGGPAASGTTQTAGIARLKSDNSTACLDIGMNGGTGAWIVSTNSGALGTRYPLSLNENGNVLIGTTTNGLSRLRVAGLNEYADNAAAISAGLTAGDVYRTGDALKVVH